MGRKVKWPPTIYSRNGRSRIRVRGVDYPLGLEGSEEARLEYARLVKELAAEVSRPLARARRWPTLAAAVLAWEESRAPSCSPDEQIHFRRAFELVLDDGRASMSTDCFKLAQLDDVLSSMLTTSWTDGGGHERIGWSLTHANRQLGRIKTFWRWLEQRGLAPEGSWAHLRTLQALSGRDPRARQKPKVRPASREDVEAVCKRLYRGPAQAMLRLQWWSAMRAGEARILRPCDVDRSSDVWIYRPTAHKNLWRGHPRVIALGPEAQAVLLPWLGGIPDEPAFRKRTGEPYSRGDYSGIVCRAAKRAGLRWFCCLSCRHGARLRITRECSLEHARSALGHATLTQTLEYASGVDLQTAIEAARKSG